MDLITLQYGNHANTDVGDVTTVCTIPEGA